MHKTKKWVYKLLLILFFFIFLHMTTINTTQVRIHESWKPLLISEFQSDYFVRLKEFLLEEKKKYTIFPPSSAIFSAFDNCPFDKVKVVILGQDPYHGPGQAHGLCFSVPDGIAFPPSLRNIFLEIQNDLDIPVSDSGNLTRWAEQGVLLLNATLTVRADSAGSHQKKGWETFTDRVIQILSEKKDHLVFFLWGNYAREKKGLIDLNKHIVLETVHPSPLSAARGFFGCRHFSACNTWLKGKGLPPIDWK
jgi:uracil-DNA glycosylase